MVKTKWQPKQDGQPFENRTFASGFGMVASLDRFKKKRAIKKYFIHAKRTIQKPGLLSGFRIVGCHFGFTIQKPFCYKNIFT
jgi:hypothetical protein